LFFVKRRWPNGKAVACSSAKEIATDWGFKIHAFEKKAWAKMKVPPCA